MRGFSVFCFGFSVFCLILRRCFSQRRQGRKGEDVGQPPSAVRAAPPPSGAPPAQAEACGYILQKAPLIRIMFADPKILLVKLSSFGDVLHTLPTLEALLQAFPGAHITWLVEAAYAPLLAGHPSLDELWLAPRLRPREFLAGPNQAILRRLLSDLRRRRFDIVLDVQGLLKSAVWVAQARSPRKVGYDRTREGSYLALTERLPPYDPEAHAVRRYLHLAHYLGAPAGRRAFVWGWIRG